MHNTRVKNSRYIYSIMAEIIDITERLEAQPKTVKADAIAAEVERLLGEQQIAVLYANAF